MRLQDTIVACSTPAGASARAMIRISGASAAACLRAAGIEPPRARGAGRAVLRMPPGGIPVLVAWFPGPGSYTGEDVAEIQLPGNPVVVSATVAWFAAREGVRPAEPGEFSARAYLHGRISVEQAEGIAALIAAEGTEHLAASRDLLNGRTGDTYRAWSEELATLLALVEAGIDFTDQEDVVPIARHALSMRLETLGLQARREISARAHEATGGPPLVVLAGAPNAGKSTLFNALLGRTRAVASPQAGTTRDVLVEPVDLRPDFPGTATVRLADLAGLERGVTGEIGAAAQARAREAVRAADAAVWCDPAGRFDDPELGRLMGGVPVVRVRTFADRPSRPGDEDVAVCSLDGWNLGELRRRVAAMLGRGRAATAAALLPRHRRAVVAMLESIERARALAGEPTTGGGLVRPEEIAQALREALDAVGELNGRMTPDEVLGRVFASFCIGK